MSRIKSDILMGLPVVTESGVRLGYVHNFVIDVETHTVVSYAVKPARIAAMLGKQNFLIHPSSVVQITETKMVVRDTTTPVREEHERGVSALKKDPLPALSSERVD